MAIRGQVWAALFVLGACAPAEDGSRPPWTLPPEDADSDGDEPDGADAAVDTGDVPDPGGTGGAPGDGGSSPPPPDGDSGGNDGDPTTGDPPAPLPDPGPEIGAFQLTFYWLTDESEFAGSPSETLYDPDCNVLATVIPAFADALTLEGTGRTLDGRVLNYYASCGCPSSPCFFEVDAEHPWGYGVQNRALAPYRSLAVDTGLLTIGTGYYIAELDGVMVPGDPPWGGFVHDGCVVADDIGGAINGAHIDFFSGLESSYLALVGTLGSPITLHAGGERCSVP